ncbi:MAG: GcrA family cell cycle regulator [Pseudomonadota bacterium]|nr:GcrA family cell cycle regulator [Pseudomonadota bacterium]
MGMTANFDREAFERMWAQGVSVTAMAERLMISKTTVLKYRHVAGLPDRDTDSMVHSQETIERIRRLWMDGKSGTEIARTFGGRWTRNKVMGLVIRNKMTRPERAAASLKKSTVKKPKAVSPSVAKAPTPKAVKGLVVGVTFPPMKPEELDQKRAELAAEGKKTIKGMDAAANDDAVPLMQAVFGQCRWPVGTPDQPRNQLVCGQPVFEGVEKCAYCLTHAKRAFARDVSLPKPNSDLERAARRYAA